MVCDLCNRDQPTFIMCLWQQVESPGDKCTWYSLRTQFTFHVFLFSDFPALIHLISFLYFVEKSVHLLPENLFDSIFGNCYSQETKDSCQFNFDVDNLKVSDGSLSAVHGLNPQEIMLPRRKDLLVINAIISSAKFWTFLFCYLTSSYTRHYSFIFRFLNS